VSNDFNWPREFPIQFGRDHATVRVKAGGFSADIDRTIAPLIREIWRAGIATVQSCEDPLGGWDDQPPGKAWVLFASGGDAEKFLRLACEPARMPSAFGGKDHWRLFVRRIDLSVPARPVMNISVMLPHRDLAEVVKKLRAHNRHRRGA
jgi:hypothetical protein